MRYILLALVCLLLPTTSRAQDLGRTDPNSGLYPDSSLVDLRFLLDPPAGRLGFLSVDRDGHFAWPNGRRARFWGVNISNHSVWVDAGIIDRVADALARAGTNMVRFEALDSIGGLLDTPRTDSSRALSRERLAALDAWTARLRQRGIYYYFDLLDFRQFRAGDGVPAVDGLGRAAKPYAVFDRRLIDLQKEYARQLLMHRNPHTGLRYVDDPALALVEVCNEHGLFFKASMLDSLVEPYRTELREMWCKWLVARYGSREGLKGAWGKVSDTVVLADSEDPGAGTVALPSLGAAPATPPPSAGAGISVKVVDVRRAPSRVRDGVRFLYDVQRGYFREMKDWLREIGLKVPVTGVVSNECVPDVASAAAEMDFTSENYYADHPAFAGRDWQGAFFYNDTNPLRSSAVYQVAPWLAALRWQGKPVVVREWATVWPNSYRCIAIPEMAAYASLQDFDAVLLFGYQVYRSPEMLSDFDHQADPTVWGLYGLGALAFLRGDIQPSPATATIAWGPDALYQWPNIIGGLHRLAWFVRLNSAVAAPPATQASRPHVALAMPRHRGARYRRRPVRRRIRHSRAARAGRSRSASVVVAPGDTLAAALDRLAKAGVGAGSRTLSQSALRSTTGQIVRDTAHGLLSVTAPRSVALCGELPTNSPVRVGPFTLVTPTGIGALMAVSLDGLPLAASRRYVVKMVSRAGNTGQSLAPAPAGAPARYLLKDWGHAPVVTYGRPSHQPMRLLRGRQALLSLALADGTWELWVRGAEAVLVCDTPGVQGTLFGRRLVTAAGAPFAVELRPRAAASARRE